MKIIDIGILLSFASIGALIIGLPLMIFVEIMKRWDL